MMNRKAVVRIGRGMALAAGAVLLAGAAVQAAGPHWQPAGWGGGGLFWSAAFHPTKPDVIYMGGDVGGVYKTTDGGAHWKMINDGLTNYAVYSLATGPAAPETVYAGTEGGLHRSTDGGLHWTFLPETAPNKLHITAERNVSIHAVALDPRDAKVLYAGTPKGVVYKSTDAGDSWTKVYAAPKGTVYSMTVSPNDSTKVFAATADAGLVESTDAGKTWTPLKTPTSAASVAVAAGNDHVLVGAFHHDGMYRSTDGGQTWTKADQGIGAKVDMLEVQIDPKDPQNVYAIGTQGWSGHFYASHDGGQSWHDSSQIKVDHVADPTLPGDSAGGTMGLSKPTNLAIDPQQPARLFISANWRPAISNDGGQTWEESDHGADISVVYALAFSGPRTYAGAMDEGTLMTADGGQTWQQLWPRKYDRKISGHDWRLAVWQKDGVDQIVATVSPWDDRVNRVVYSRDGGKTFEISQDGLPKSRPTANTMWGEGYMRALAQDPSNPDVLYAGIDGAASNGHEAGGVFKSTDGGKTWARLPGQPASRRMFFGLAVDPTDAQRLFWATAGSNGGLYRSDDGGQTWQHVFKNEEWLFNVLVTPKGTVYTGGHNLWRSDDHGKTWRTVTNFKDGEQIVGLAVNPANDNEVWLSRTTWNAGDQGGVWQTTDGAKTWTDITGDLPYRKPLVLEYNPATKELWAAGVGIYKLQR